MYVKKKCDEILNESGEERVSIEISQGHSGTYIVYNACPNKAAESRNNACGERKTKWVVKQHEPQTMSARVIILVAINHRKHELDAYLVDLSLKGDDRQLLE